MACLACAACALVARPAGAQPAGVSTHPLLGIGDNKFELFSDPRFLALGITQVRYDVPWDALTANYPHHNYEAVKLALWLTAAQKDGLTPLITFDHSSVSGKAAITLPTVARYSAAFLKFRNLYPWVTQFSTWNEANYYGEAISRQPRIAAEYYLALRRDCPTCTILAAELLDAPARFAENDVQWAHQFIHYAHQQPEYWGLHNYLDANKLEDSATKALLGGVTGNIWFTETGGLVYRANTTDSFPEGLAHSAVVDRYILTKLANLSPRIQRIYLYEWNAITPHDGWDSALISSTGAPRESYDVVAETLLSWGIRPDCAISRVPPTCTGIGAGGKPLSGS